jgi:hypothetical protein
MEKLRNTLVAEVILGAIQANWYYDDIFTLVILHSKLQNTAPYGEEVLTNAFQKLYFGNC